MIKRLIDMENAICARVDESTAHIQQRTEMSANKTSTILASAESRTCAQRDQTKADVLSEVDSVKSSLTSLVIRMFDELRKELSSQGAQTRTLEQKLERILESPKSRLNTNSQMYEVKQDIRNLRCSLLRDNTTKQLACRVPRSSDNAQKRAVPFGTHHQQQRRFLPDIPKDVITGGVLTMFCVLYGHPSVKKAARALAVRISCDPILALLIICAGYFFARHFSNTPMSPSIGSQHTLRSSDPFVTWPQIDFKKTRCRAPHPARFLTSNLFIFNGPLEGVLGIDFTHKDISSRYSQVVLGGDYLRKLEFSMTGIQNLGLVYLLLASELQSTPGTTVCRTCECHHSCLSLKADVQVIIRVFFEVLEWSKTIPLEIWGQEPEIRHRQPRMRHTRHPKASRKSPKYE